MNMKYNDVDGDIHTLKIVFFTPKKVEPILYEKKCNFSKNLFENTHILIVKEKSMMERAEKPSGISYIVYLLGGEI